MLCYGEGQELEIVIACLLLLQSPYVDRVFLVFILTLRAAIYCDYSLRYFLPVFIFGRVVLAWYPWSGCKLGGFLQVELAPFVVIIAVVAVLAVDSGGGVLKMVLVQVPWLWITMSWSSSGCSLLLLFDA